MAEQVVWLRLRFLKDKRVSQTEEEKRAEFRHASLE